MLSPVQCLLLQAWTLSLAGSGACSGLDTKSHKVQLSLAHSDNDNVPISLSLGGRPVKCGYKTVNLARDTHKVSCTLSNLSKKQKKKNGSNSSTLQI